MSEILKSEVVYVEERYAGELRLVKGVLTVKLTDTLPQTIEHFDPLLAEKTRAVRPEVKTTTKSTYRKRSTNGDLGVAYYETSECFLLEDWTPEMLATRPTTH